VSVREGQGVVLLCGPPPHHGGMTNSPTSCAAWTSTAIAQEKYPIHFPACLTLELISAWSIGVYKKFGFHFF